MYALLITIFVIVAVALVFVILVQSGKGGGLAGIAGGGDTGSVFGGKGTAPFLTKITTILAAVFMVVALVLGFMTRGVEDESSIMERERARRMASPARTLPEAAQPAAEPAETVPQQ